MDQEATHYWISTSRVISSPALFAALAICVSVAIAAQLAKQAWLYAALLACFCGVIVILARDLWQRDKDFLRFAHLPLISFGDHSLTYRSSGKTDKTNSANYSDITGVEVVINKYEAFIRIQKWGAPSEEIQIRHINAKPQRVFSTFKQRLPGLVQPRETDMQLIAPRYLPKETNKRP